MSTDNRWTDYFDKPDDPYVEDLNLGGTWLLDLVAAVDFLRRGDRHGLTVWDAIEEAVRWWVDERMGAVDGVPDHAALPADPRSLDRTLNLMLETLDLEPAVTAPIAMQQAIRYWLDAIGSIHNDGLPILVPGRRDP